MISPTLVQDIQVEDLTAYLGAAGWTRKSDYPRPELLVFQGPPADDGEPVACVFPSSGSARGFADDLTRVLQALSVIENRDPYDIALDIKHMEMDRLQVRLISELSASGSLPLTFAALVIASFRDLMVSAACVEEQPRPFYAKATKVGGSFAQQCRFGQTAYGSFIVNIEAPVTPVFGTQLEMGVPFARRVTRRIMRGLGRVHSAVLDGRPDALLNTSYQDGLNANMLEALLPMREGANDLRIEVASSFSKRVPIEADVPSRVYVENRAFEYMEGAARALRGNVESRPRHLSGKIIRLADEPEDESDGTTSEDERIVTLRFVDNGRRQHVRFQLDEAQYRLACDAHRDNKEVEVNGTLERSGKQWHLMSVTQFNLAHRK